MKTYAIPDQVLNAAVQLLNSMPALQSRGVLNAIEAIVRQQEQAEQAAAGKPPTTQGGGGTGEPDRT